MYFNFESYKNAKLFKQNFQTTYPRLLRLRIHSETLNPLAHVTTQDMENWAIGRFLYCVTTQTKARKILVHLTGYSIPEHTCAHGKLRSD